MGLPWRPKETVGDVEGNLSLSILFGLPDLPNEMWQQEFVTANVWVALKKLQHRNPAYLPEIKNKRREKETNKHLPWCSEAVTPNA